MSEASPELQPEPTVAAGSDNVEDAIRGTQREDHTYGPTTAPPEPKLPKKYVTKMMAELRKLEQARGRRLSRDDRLAYFAQLAGLQQLDSMNDLTETEARTIIDALIAAQPAEQPAPETDTLPSM
jgi:hypothetical protein